MEFDDLFIELLQDRTLKLQFASGLEVKAFRSSFGVFVYRQVKRLQALGMDSDISNKSLCTRIDDTTLEVSFRRKSRKQHSFQILEVKQNNSTKEEESRSGESGTS